MRYMVKEQDEERITTIRISVKTKNRLDPLGKKGDSYEDIIKKLIDSYEKKKK